MINKRERLVEEFEIEDEDEVLNEYSSITATISVNFSLIADELSKLINFQRGIAVDIGTGLGELAKEVAKRHPGLQVIGIDISEKSLAIAKQRVKEINLSNLEFKVEDAHRLSFSEDSVDLVVSHGTLHHFKDVSRILLEIYRILKPGALAYLSDLRRDVSEEIVKQVAINLAPKQAKAFVNSVQASYTPPELKEILLKLGIKNCEVFGQRFSRETIAKNIDRLRKSAMRGLDYNKLSQTIIIRK